MRHLDLSCGSGPHNPCEVAKLFGSNILEPVFVEQNQPIEFRLADLALEGIPFSENYFYSVSAINFLEPLPRQVTVAEQKIIHLLT